MSEAKPTSGQCWFFNTPGGCKNGDQCQFFHHISKANKTNDVVVIASSTTSTTTVKTATSIPPMDDDTHSSAVDNSAQTDHVMDLSDQKEEIEATPPTVKTTRPRNKCWYGKKCGKFKCYFIHPPATPAAVAASMETEEEQKAAEPMICQNIEAKEPFLEAESEGGKPTNDSVLASITTNKKKKKQDAKKSKPKVLEDAQVDVGVEEDANAAIVVSDVVQKEMKDGMALTPKKKK